MNIAHFRQFLIANSHTSSSSSSSSPNSSSNSSSFPSSNPNLLNYPNPNPESLPSSIPLPLLNPILTPSSNPNLKLIPNSIPNPNTNHSNPNTLETSRSLNTSLIPPTPISNPNPKLDPHSNPRPGPNFDHFSSLFSLVKDQQTSNVLPLSPQESSTVNNSSNKSINNTAPSSSSSSSSSPPPPSSTSTSAFSFSSTSSSLVINPWSSSPSSSSPGIPNSSTVLNVVCTGPGIGSGHQHSPSGRTNVVQPPYNARYSYINANPSLPDAAREPLHTDPGLRTMTSPSVPATRNPEEQRTSKRIKLQISSLKDLEKALLEDNDDDDYNDFVHGLEPVACYRDRHDYNGNTTIAAMAAAMPGRKHESFVTSCSSAARDSMVASGSITDITTSRATMTPSRCRDLLLSCAKAVDDGDLALASSILESCARGFGSSSIGRLAPHFVDGLAVRISKMASEGHQSGSTSSCSSNNCSGTTCVKISLPMSLTQARVLQKDPCPSTHNGPLLSKAVGCPLFTFGHLAANGIIADKFCNERRVHIVDFGGMKARPGIDDLGGNVRQWESLLHLWATRPGGPPHVRLTRVSSLRPSTTHNDLEGIGRNLQEFARKLGLGFEFRGVQIDIENEMESLGSLEKGLVPGEALAVNFAFQLHHVPDESVSTSNPRDRLLRIVRAMRPQVVTLIEHEASTNTSPFYSRFAEALSYFEGVSETLDRSGEGAGMVERCLLGEDIVNVVSCEGGERSRRYEVFGKWKSRMGMAGFEGVCMKGLVSKGMFDGLVGAVPRRTYRVREECGALFFDARQRPLVAASAWK